MPGNGTKLAITQNNPAPVAYLLDITRLISRAGRTATGVDRVELAYLRYFAHHPAPFFAIARTTLGYVVVSRTGALEIIQRITGTRPWGMADRWSRLARSKPLVVRQAESDLRRFAVGRCRPRGLQTMLTRLLPKGATYLNTGHSNITDRMFDGMKQGVQGRIAVLIHDTIPLDYPHHQRPSTPDRFRAMLRRVQSKADIVIYNSQHTQECAHRYMAKWGPIPPGFVAHLGVDIPVPDHAKIPPEIDLESPYFVTLGTIEPRKGHDVLLDVWEGMNGDPGQPRLLICGSRGWNNKPVFDRLDRLTPNDNILELPGLSDGAIAALIMGSCGVLCPSEAEGFGLPPLEAAVLGVPVVCADLPVYREILGDIPVYVDNKDRNKWENATKCLIIDMKNSKLVKRSSDFTPPSWGDHFNTVLRFT